MSTEASLESKSASPSKSLHIALWVVQALLAAMFLMGGATKLTTPVEALAAQMPWVTGPLGGLVRFIGISEVAGALGLILPAVTRIQPRFTVAAAIGLATIMLLAALTHASRAEWPMIGVNAVLGGFAVFVAWGRTVKAPIAAR